ncbi:MAG TPA: hypothetical protein PLO23_03330 [Alphaproteobacteria bacterium]|nr:hypothetical protein [Alphaproteobacteria bacterium]
MEESERMKIRDEQTKEIYCSIGEYIVQFELLVYNMSLGIRILIQSQGLKSTQIAGIILSDLTAMPIKKILQGMIAEVGSLSKEEQKISDKIFSDIIKVIEGRNELIHSTWFVGWGNNETVDFSMATGHKYKTTKAGLEIRSMNRTAENFKEITAEIIRLQELVMRLWGCVHGGHKVINNFEIKDGKVFPKFASQS